MFHVSSLIFHTVNEGAQGIFLSLSPYPSTILFLIPAGSPTRDILQLLCTLAYVISISVTVVARVHFGREPAEQTGRACDLQLNIYANIVCSEDYVYYRPESNQERALSLCLAALHSSLRTNRVFYCISRLRIIFTYERFYCTIRKTLLCRWRDFTNI